MVNAFDPWARDRGEYYSLDWKARVGAEGDEAFANNKKCRGGLLISCARGTGEGMEADDLLCSRNARSRTPLVGRAQWKINQPPSLKR